MSRLPATLAEVPNGAPPDGQLSPATMEGVLLGGDLARLTPAQRLEWYIARCDAAGLDPRTQPFLYVTLSGKLTLYATKSCTEQLRKVHGVSVTALETRLVGDIYVATCHVRDKTGREDVATGAVPVKGLIGDNLANAYMKAETKAKRRATLSLCGLGMLDESELETVADARTVDPDAPALPGPRRPNPEGGSPATDKTFTDWASGFTTSVNDRWKALLEEAGERPGDLLSFYQLVGHLNKWAIAEGYHADRPEGWKVAHRNRALGIVFATASVAVIREAQAYALKLKAAAEARLQGEAVPADDLDVPESWPDEPGADG
jgi:hypothetical protein